MVWSSNEVASAAPRRPRSVWERAMDTHRDEINADLLAFPRGISSGK